MPEGERRHWTRDVDHVGRMRDQLTAERAAANRSARHRLLVFAILFAIVVGGMVGATDAYKLPTLWR